MSRNIKNYTIVDRVGIVTDTFTAVAATDVCTATAHAFKNGDMVVLSGADLPAGLATSTVYWVIEVTTDTFKLSASSCERYTTNVNQQPVPEIDITDAGTPTHTITMHDIGRNIDVSDFRHCIASVHGASSANIDIGFVGSIGKSPTDESAPDFSAAAAYNNSWTYLQTINLISATAVNGSAAAISQTGTNKHELHEINTNGIKWLNILMSGWSAGSVTVVVRLFND